jgi:hypothetical protein
MNGLGSVLRRAAYPSMAVTSSGTLVNTPQRRRLSKMWRKKRSTMFSHDTEVGVKCMLNLGCLCVA